MKSNSFNKEKKIMDVESDTIQVPPKPFARPIPSAIFHATPQLNLTPEKQSKNNTKKRRNLNQDECSLDLQGEIRANDAKVLVNAYDKLGHPSVNSTALIANTLKAAQHQKFNAALAVKEELMNSEASRIKISEKIAQTVNVKKSQKIYSNLVPVDINEEEVISSHKVVRIPRFPKRISDIAEPDIMTFFSEHFVEERADFDFDILTGEEPLPKPFPVSLSHAFDFYHHMKCWQPHDRQPSKKPDN